MKIHLVAMGAKIELSYLVDYRLLMENSLKAQIIKFDEWTENETKNLDQEQKDEFWDFYSDEYSEINNVIPNIFRSSLFVAAYSFLEKHLVSHCTYLWRKNHYQIEPVFYRGIIFRARNYLRDNAGISIPENSPNWCHIVSCNEIRNALVHDGGKLNAQRLAKLTNFLVLHPSITLDRFNRVMLGEDACRDFINAIRGLFFDEIFKVTQK